MRPLRPERTSDQQETQRFAESIEGAAERLHQWLHQNTESGERSVAAALVKAIVETLGDDAIYRILNTLKLNAEAAAASDD